MSRISSGRRIAWGALAFAATAALSLAGILALSAPTLAAKQPKSGAPSVSTGGVSHVHGNSLQLQGTVDPNGAATTYYFQWGPTVAYGSQTTPASLPAEMKRVKVGQTVTGLLPGFHYRIVATNSFGTKPGHDRTYKAKSSKSAFKLPKSIPNTVYGGALVISGTLSGADNAGQKVILQASPYPYHSAFTTTGLPVLTSSTGAFTFRVSRLTTSTQFRVSTVATRPLYSKTLTAQVAVRVSLKVRTAKRKGLVRLYGTVSPALARGRVYVQLLEPARPGHNEKTEERTTKYASKLSTPLKHATKTMSRYSAIMDITQTGRYRVYVKLPSGKQAYAAGASQSVVLKAGPAPAKGKKKQKGT
ncbi:MAG TPA: hypothetical protein VL972_07245 [Solirubrobacteraceae bacterium]|nr:hypothetical protein [Solirubrobacteraceae bacterium]